METLELENLNYIKYCTINSGQTLIIVEYDIEVDENESWDYVWETSIKFLMAKTEAESLIVADKANVWE